MVDSEILTAAQNAGLDESQAQRLTVYLEQYGHFDTPEAAPLAQMEGVEAAESKLLTAVASLQSYAGMEPQGIITPQVLRILELPRCGVADVLPLQIEAAKWRKNKLTYHVGEFVGGLSQKDQTDLIEQSWNDWEANADLELTGMASRTTSDGKPVDILILTGRGRAYGFDGSSGTLAWAYLPGGDDRPLYMRFDLDERFLKEGSAGILFRNVACHEFGHLLGLDHSRRSDQLMSAFYSAAVFKPLDEDIARIQGLYGKPKTPPPPTAGSKKTITIEIEGSISSAKILSVA